MPAGVAPPLKMPVILSAAKNPCICLCFCCCLFFFNPPTTNGCPILRAFAKGGKQDFTRPRGLYPTVNRPTIAEQIAEQGTSPKERNEVISTGAQHSAVEKSASPPPTPGMSLPLDKTPLTGSPSSHQSHTRQTKSTPKVFPSKTLQTFDGVGVSRRPHECNTQIQCV
jgi:hypothetical protein